MAIFDMVLGMNRREYFRDYYWKTRERRLESRKESWERTGRPPKEIRYLRELAAEAKRCGI
jgi:hypothetical protein